ncbi:MAG: DNA topoisomerase IV subunit A [Rickettsiaceae bacterium]|nr:MAG: DNA topoisomerase IV subunit A [Rickettsiaceae bacterium]
MDEINNKIEDINFDQALSQRYLAYALSTIMSRSLPDVRDGLKPVHRRLLYAMLQLRLDPKSNYKKCARVVGDVIGKYHPHGDTAVYDTLVRLAQNFSLRYPLIDGQGNFGSIDGDNPAAMRYTESKMTEICLLLMNDIDKDTVDFRLTYDDSDHEPILMPASFPNLLANGSEGIAVGMATSVPPHNLAELCDALVYLIDRPNTTTKHLLSYIKGPDFPTGGILIDNVDTIHQAYDTGKGSFVVRARWLKEDLSHGLYQIIITEIPYQVQKSKLMEHIAELLKDKKIPLVSNIRDESAEDIRIVIEPKNRNCDPAIVMESLFKLTSLEEKIQLNMNVLCADSTPKVMNLVEVLKEFLAHRQNIIIRRSKFIVRQISHKIELLSGLIIAYSSLDEIIAIIRNEDEPKELLMTQFSFSEIQAEAILNTKLRSLKKIEEQQIIKDLDNLNKQKITLEEILQNSEKLWKLVKKELKDVQTKFGANTAIGKRRTSLQQMTNIPKTLDITAFIEREPITVLCSKMGWIRSVKGHNSDLLSIKYKEGDEQQFVLECFTTDKLIICTNDGKFFSISCDNISKGKSYGESIKLMVDIKKDILQMFIYKPEQNILLASSSGRGFVANLKDVISSTKLGKQVIQNISNHQCIVCLPVNDGNAVATTGENRRINIFSLDEIPQMKKGQGVVLQKFKDAKLTDVKVFDKEKGLSWIINGKLKIEKNLLTWQSVRGSRGALAPTGFAKDNKFCS